MKTKKNLLIIAVSAMIIVSCQKQECPKIITPNQQSTTSPSKYLVLNGKIEPSTTPVKKITYIITKNSAPILSLTVTGDYEKWDVYAKKCICVTDNVCCAPPPSLPDTIVAIPLYNKFVESFNNNTIQYFFNNNDYTILWPLLASVPTVTNGLKNGSLRMIYLDNIDLGISNYLIGSNSSSDAQILNNPIFTVYWYD